MHGMSEHGGRYGHLATVPNNVGFNVSEDDYLGRGLTGKKLIA